MAAEAERSVALVVQPQWVQEGGGVRLRRSIGGSALDQLDPFLLFDHFESDRPEDYSSGFPLHPHRGIETVTYLLAGEIRHRDTLGNDGLITAGGLEWMTAGGGILHEEMPRSDDGHLAGFQLWVNLPAALKMSRPRYQHLRPDEIPEVSAPGGGHVRVLAGQAVGVAGPVGEIYAAPTYLDVSLPPGATFGHLLPRDHSAFAYVLSGRGTVGAGDDGSVVPRLVVLKDGEMVRAQAGDAGLRFFLVAGAPLREPVARYGPFVMNTREQIEEALRDLRAGTFVRTGETESTQDARPDNGGDASALGSAGARVA
jgi:redox-sensitive bicupin YhaK (pirin superfamily)